LPVLSALAGAANTPVMIPAASTREPAREKELNFMM
jgi:hypothetical protein